MPGTRYRKSKPDEGERNSEFRLLPEILMNLSKIWLQESIKFLIQLEVIVLQKSKRVNISQRNSII